MIDKKNKIIFYYPAANIGGAQLLFARMAEKLIINGYNVVLLDSNNCFIYQYLSDKNLSFEYEMVSSTNPFHMGKSDILIISLSFVYLFHEVVIPHNESRFVFLDLHPYALIENLSFSKVYKQINKKFIINIVSVIERSLIYKIRQFVHLGVQQNGVFFMCQRNFRINQDVFNLNIKPKYIPIPIPITPDNFEESNKDYNQICWISRLSHDKSLILDLLVNDTLAYNSTNLDKKVLHIIGDGSELDNYLRLSTQYPDYIKTTGVLMGENLSKYLYSNKIGVGFSMGTSALEFGSRGIATVLVPSITEYNYFKDTQNRYLWLNNSKNYDVATYPYQDTMSFIEICKTVKDQDVLSKDYVIQNHSINSVYELLVTMLEKNTFTYLQILQTELYDSTYWELTLKKLKQYLKSAEVKLF